MLIPKRVAAQELIARTAGLDQRGSALDQMGEEARNGRALALGAVSEATAPAPRAPPGIENRRLEGWGASVGLGMHCGRAYKRVYDRGRPESLAG